MKTVFARGLSAAGVFGLATLLVPAAPAQENGKVHRVEIVEGSRTRVRLVPLGPVSPEQRAQLAKANADEDARARQALVAASKEQFGIDARDVERSRLWALRNYYNYSALSS